MRLNDAFKALIVRFRGVRANPAAQRAFAIGQWVLLALIVAYLLWRLTHIGWLAVVDHLPSSPWFYVFLSLKFLTLPVTETFVYQIIWERPLLRHFPAFVRKRVYNSAVAGYSGEAFLTLWARRRLGLSEMNALVSVKDSNFLSAFSANVTTLALIVWLLAGGAPRGGLEALPGGAALFAVAFLLAATFATCVVLFRKRLISLPWRKARTILSLHAVRQIAQLAIYSGMYAAALPSAPVAAWFVFIALQYVITRIPFLPNQELIYLGAALSLSSIAGVPEEAVAGMLLAEAGLLQGLYIVLFFATAHLARTGPQAAAAGPTAQDGER